MPTLPVLSRMSLPILPLVRLIPSAPVVLMLAIRRPFAAASFLLFCGVAYAQNHSHSQPPIPEPLPLLDVTEIAPHDATSHEWAVDAPMPVEEYMAMEPAPCASCACGKKQCHGVCTDPGHPKKPLIKRPGDRSRGDCPPKRYRIPDCKRAGNPHCVAPWAKCSVDSKYSSWFVGGGSPFLKGRCRESTEGTWGLDYGGLFGHARVWMNYTRYNRHQGGEGAYETDGEPAFVKKAHKLLHIGH